MSERTRVFLTLTLSPPSPRIGFGRWEKQHYVRLYWTGNRTDCGSPDCLHSMAHRHKTAKTCKCSRVCQHELLVLPIPPFPLYRVPLYRAIFYLFSVLISHNFCARSRSRSRHATPLAFFIIVIYPPYKTIYEDRRVLNLIQEPCDNCKEASYDRGRRR